MFIPVLGAFGGGPGTPEAFFGPGGGNFGFGAALGSGAPLAMSFGHALSGGGGGFGDPFEVGRRGLYGGGNFTGGFSFALAGGPAVAWTSRAGGGSFATAAGDAEVHSRSLWLAS